jgi:hypothetical protein
MRLPRLRPSRRDSIMKPLKNSLRRKRLLPRLRPSKRKSRKKPLRS